MRKLDLLQGLCFKLKALAERFRFGKITSNVKGTAGDGVASEIEYRGRGNRVVGYWAYGYFDPQLPYKG